MSIKDFLSLEQSFTLLPGSTLYWVFETSGVRFGSDFTKHHLTGKKSHKPEMFKYWPLKIFN